ncbi:UNVERIFIED_CONTAM: hypothetical protein K2H54_053353 [Gekko kuhli]
MEDPAPLRTNVEAKDQRDVRKDESMLDQEEEPAKVSRPPCVQAFYPDMGRVQKFSEVAKDFPRKVDPYSCPYCESLALLQDSDAETDSEESGTDSGVETEPETAKGEGKESE